MTASGLMALPSCERALVKEPVFVKTLFFVKEPFFVKATTSGCCERDVAVARERLDLWLFHKSSLRGCVWTHGFSLLRE